ncbi:hypothetical protein FOL47_009852 [Perkinsus chesapeaki]|uniref:3'-5' exonuclease domain-containing protein n=1 Tax=Perkinsus chesapeaki TaxID=330153 RepID=A0A7J6L640_PERCH|nr:hypothetical protein FOL47_009852 [Perkinsus chesapeaki]
MPPSSSSSTASTASHHLYVTHEDVIAKLESEGAAYDTSEDDVNDCIDLKCMVYDLNTDASPFHTVLVCLDSSNRVDESSVLARLGLATAPRGTLTMTSDCEASVGQVSGSIGPLCLPDSDGVVCLVTSDLVSSKLPIRISAGFGEHIYLKEPSSLLHLLDASQVLLLDVNAWLISPAAAAARFDPSSSDGGIGVITSKEQLKAFAELWSDGITIVGVDSERDPETQAISLIQMSVYSIEGLHKDAIIDVTGGGEAWIDWGLGWGIEVQVFDDKDFLGRELEDLFVSFNSLKLLHSAVNDLRHFELPTCPAVAVAVHHIQNSTPTIYKSASKNSFGKSWMEGNFEACDSIRDRVNNLLDTQVLGSCLGQDRLGLAKLAERYLGVKMDKTLQTADWSRRPLTDEMLNYGIGDARVLLPLIKAMTEQAEDTKIIPLTMHNSVLGKTVGRNSLKSNRSANPSRERRGGRSWHVKKPVYGNVALEDPTGLLMCRISKQKSNWYVRKNLADEVEAGKIRLRFFPKGPGHAGNSVYLNKRENICVVCGSDQFISRHFIVPNCYRKHLPPEYKSHCPYDIVLMCSNCKVKANMHSDELREKYAVEFEAPVQGVGCRNTGLYKARRAARILLSKDGPRMPEAKREEFWQALHDVGIYDDPNEAFSLSEDGKEEYSGKKGNTDSTYESHGEVVVKKLGDKWPEFVAAWRKDFVDFMKPEHLPEDWSPDRDWRLVSEVELEEERRIMYAKHLRDLGEDVPVNEKPIRPTINGH